MKIKLVLFVMFFSVNLLADEYKIYDINIVDSNITINGIKFVDQNLTLKDVNVSLDNNILILHDSNISSSIKFLNNKTFEISRESYEIAKTNKQITIRKATIQTKDQSHIFSPSRFYNLLKGDNHITTDLYVSYDIFQAKETKSNVNFGLGAYLQTPNIHYYGNIYLKDYTNVTNEDTNQQEIKTSISSNIGLVYPLPFAKKIIYNSTDNFGNETVKDTNGKHENGIIGLILEGSATKVSDNYKSIRESYIGIRFALIPNKYFDLMYGKTANLERRIKIRTEYQLDFSMIFGATYSFEPTGKDLTEENQDIFRAYVRVPISLEYIKHHLGI